MRYKFRVWNEELEEMYTISKEKYLGSTGIVDPYVGHEKAVWMQFTGLTDKNGKEIYEGDIITTDIDSIKGTLIYRYGCFQVKYGHEKYKSLINISYPEVIGNIYQHKHLLKENEQ